MQIDGMLSLEDEVATIDAKHDGIHTDTRRRPATDDRTEAIAPVCGDEAGRIVRLWRHVFGDRRRRRRDVAARLEGYLPR